MSVSIQCAEPEINPQPELMPSLSAKQIPARLTFHESRVIDNRTQLGEESRCILKREYRYDR